jgi:hypothetical protein
MFERRLTRLRALFQLQQKLEQKALEENRIPYESAAGEYIVRMNLREEFNSLSSHAVVWDAGCGTGEQTEGLQAKYPFLFLGINNHPLSRFGSSENTVPIIYGLLEEMDSNVESQARNKNRFPPELILFSRTLPYSLQSSTTSDILRATHRVLTPRGKALIYEETDSYYDEFLGIIYQDGLHQGFQVTQLRNRRGERYLRLAKKTDVSF